MKATRSDRRRSLFSPTGRILWLAIPGLALAPAVLAAGRQASGRQVYAAYQIACAPRGVRAMAPPTVHVTGSPVPGRRLFGAGDLVTLDRGTDDGLAADQEYFVRRLVAPSDRAAARRDPWLHVHTAGWVRLVQVTPTSAVARVLYACDAMEPGDFLEPFALPEVPAPSEPAGTPDYEHAGRVLFGGGGWTMAGSAAFVVVDLGAEDQVVPGRRVTFFRRSGSDPAAITPVARGTAVIVLPESATVRVEEATEPVVVGDLAALHRPGGDSPAGGSSR